MQTASVKWIGEEKFVATSPSGHAIAIDSDRASNKAPGPMELVLDGTRRMHGHRCGQHPEEKAAKTSKLWK